jgi:Ni,Fe-hydrogenase I cytochrome b subunit
MSNTKVKLYFLLNQKMHTQPTYNPIVFYKSSDVSVLQHLLNDLKSQVLEKPVRAFFFIE